MNDIIHHLRKQPESTKRYILHFVTVVAGIVLASLWVYSLGATLTDASEQAKAKKAAEPFSALKANIIDGYNSISQGNNQNTNQ